MRGKSHASVGEILLREYLPGLSERNKKFFLIGCIQPDRNPTTYLKGSIRNRWMHGHDYGNASRFIIRLAKRLERSGCRNAWDYYTLGKLMHYTIDAFTYAHNAHFPKTLLDHRRYEVQLQTYFLRHLRALPLPERAAGITAADLILQAHAEYITLPGCIETDTHFAFRVCCQVMEILTASNHERQKYRFLSVCNDDIMKINS